MIQAMWHYCARCILPITFHMHTKASRKGLVSFWKFVVLVCYVTLLIKHGASLFWKRSCHIQSYHLAKWCYIAPLPCKPSHHHILESHFEVVLGILRDITARRWALLKCVFFIGTKLLMFSRINNDQNFKIPHAQWCSVIMGCYKNTLTISWGSVRRTNRIYLSISAHRSTRYTKWVLI